MSCVRSSLALVALSFSVGCPGCIEEEFDPITPKLFVVDPFDAEVEHCTYTDDENTELESCAYHFGDVAIGEGRFLKFLVKNSSTVALTISSMRIESTDGEPQFTLADVRVVGENATETELVKPADVDDGSPVLVVGDPELLARDVMLAEVTVRYTPRFEASAEATLIITSDAGNVLGGPERDGETVDLAFHLTGNGLDLGRPQIRIEPEVCNFGQVGVNVAAFCELTISNDGTRDLAMDQFRFSDDTPVASSGADTYDLSLHVFGVQSSVFLPQYIAPGTGTTVRLFANPEVVGPASGQLLIHSNDPLTPDVTVGLQVEGAIAPTAICKIASINGVPNNNPSPQIRPLDDVVLTAGDSQASTPGATIASYEWWIISRPLQSSNELTTVNQQTTQFTFNSSGSPVMAVDVAGFYDIGCRVTDTTGAVSTNDARVSFNVIPSDALHVQLTWDSPNYDYDLHLLKDNGGWCSQNSCYYGNCNTNAPTTILPEWDGIGGVTPGDPTLDIDDLSGYGPENINVDEPTDAVYRIGVHAYDFTVSTDVWVTVKVYVNGALAYEDSREMSIGKSFWQVAEVDWFNGAATIYPVNLFQDTPWACP